MAVVLRLQRTGKPKQAHFRVVAIDKRRGPHGEPIEVLGYYNPRADKKTDKVVLKGERVDHWLKVGAIASETVGSLIRSSKKAAAAPAKAAK